MRFDLRLSRLINDWILKNGNVRKNDSPCKDTRYPQDILVFLCLMMDNHFCSVYQGENKNVDNFLICLITHDIWSLLAEHTLLK